jgi:hypothetical protein
MFSFLKIFGEKNGEKNFLFFKKFLSKEKALFDPKTSREKYEKSFSL